MGNNIHTVRRANLRLLIEKWNGTSNLAKKLEYSGPSYLSQMLNPKGRPLTEKTARKIETALDLPTGWMDGNQLDGSSKPKQAAVNTELFFEVIDAVNAVLEAEKIALPKFKFHDVVSMVYEEALEDGLVKSGIIARLVRIAR